MSAVSITLGIFDLFAYAVPGSLYLGLFTYVAWRTDWIQLTWLHEANTTLLVIGAILASYLLGHVFFILGQVAVRLNPAWRDQPGAARVSFLDRVPAAANRRYVSADIALLHAAIEVRQQGATVEIVRLRAVGLMLRNSAPAFAFGALTAAVEIVTGPAPAAVCCSLLFAFSAPISLVQGYRISTWGISKTLEIGFWIDGIDAASGSSTPERAPTDQPPS